MCMIQALSYIVMDISSAKSSGSWFFIQQQTLAALTMCWLLILCFAIVCGYCYAKCCNKSSVQSLSDKDVVFRHMLWLLLKVCFASYMATGHKHCC